MTDLTPQRPSWLTQHVEDDDLIRDMLKDKRSINTRRAYEKDLKYFFRFATGADPTQQLVSEFLKLAKTDAIKVVLRYKAHLMASGLKEATVNRRLSAIKSLATFARKLGKCDFTLEEIEGEKSKSYRDTSGITPDEFKKLLEVPDRSTLRGKRDYALLRLLWSNALRRSETLTTIDDFDPSAGKLTIIGKGRGTECETVDLPSVTVEAINDWLKCREKKSPLSQLFAGEALFIALDNANYGKPLTGDGVYTIVRGIAELAGIKKKFSPHRIRHSTITSALNATNGDVRRVQQLSRHRKADTLLIYDDNRKNAQKELSDIVSNLV